MMTTKTTRFMETIRKQSEKDRVELVARSQEFKRLLPELNGSDLFLKFTEQMAGEMK